MIARSFPNIAAGILTAMERAACVSGKAILRPT